MPTVSNAAQIGLPFKGLNGGTQPRSASRDV